MKLNLGCGKNYKEGFINIDLFDKTVCDKAISVDNLSYKDNSIKLIEADHLIEHLGYIKSSYALSEWFRILKPNGKLILETPDIEKSFKRYLENSDEKIKRETLNWVFGHETKGYGHLFCFDIKTLKELLIKIGFINIKIEEPKTYPEFPSMRISCKKPEKSILSQAFAKIRKRAHEEFKDIINNQILGMELELKIDVSKVIMQNTGKDRKEHLDKLFVLISKYSPQLTYIIFKILEEEGIVKGKKYKILAKKLDLNKFIQKEYLLLIRLNHKSKSQAITLKTLNLWIDTYLQFILGNAKRNNIIEYFEQISVNMRNFDKYKIFSNGIIDELANENFAKAKKYFMLKDYTKFKKFLKTAGSLNANIKNTK